MISVGKAGLFDTGMCLSWIKGSLSDHPYYAHSSGGAGYYCEVGLYSGLGVGDVVMFNITGTKREHIIDKLDKYCVNKFATNFS